MLQLYSNKFYLLFMQVQLEDIQDMRLLTIESRDLLHGLISSYQSKIIWLNVFFVNKPKLREWLLQDCCLPCQYLKAPGKLLQWILLKGFLDQILSTASWRGC